MEEAADLGRRCGQRRNLSVGLGNTSSLAGHTQQHLLKPWTVSSSTSHDGTWEELGLTPSCQERRSEQSEGIGCHQQAMAVSKLSGCSPAAGHCLVASWRLIQSSGLTTTQDGGTAIIPSLQVRTPCHREVEQLTKGHTAWKW